MSSLDEKLKAIPWQDPLDTGTRKGRRVEIQLPPPREPPPRSKPKRASWVDSDVHSLFEAGALSAPSDDDDSDEDGSGEDSEENVEAREARNTLRQHTDIKSVLRAWWGVADSDGSGFLEKDEYVVLNMKIYIAMTINDGFDAEEARACAERDWCSSSCLFQNGPCALCSVLCSIL